MIPSKLEQLADTLMTIIGVCYLSLMVIVLVMAIVGLIVMAVKTFL